MTAVIMKVKMSHAETETTICLQAMQISKNVSHSNLDFLIDQAFSSFLCAVIRNRQRW